MHKTFSCNTGLKKKLLINTLVLSIKKSVTCLTAKVLKDTHRTYLQKKTSKSVKMAISTAGKDLSLTNMWRSSLFLLLVFQPPSFSVTLSFYFSPIFKCFFSLHLFFSLHFIFFLLFWLRMLLHLLSLLLYSLSCLLFFLSLWLASSLFTFCRSSSLLLYNVASYIFHHSLFFLFSSFRRLNLLLVCLYTCLPTSLFAPPSYFFIHFVILLHVWHHFPQCLALFFPTLFSLSS